MARDYERTTLVERAEKARKRGRRRAAIASYRALLAVDRNEHEIHAKLAPLLARTGQAFDAWLSFRAAAEGFMRAGDPERALGVYYEAAHHLPRQPEIWQTIARLQCARGKQDEALRALANGRARVRRRRDRAKAIYLLRESHEIAPWAPNVVLDLARLLWRTRQRGEALLMLEALAQRARGRELCCTRRLQFRISHRPLHAWLWFESWRRALAAKLRRPDLARPERARPERVAAR